MQNNKLKLAILDMNNGWPNQGMRCIRDIVNQFSDLIDSQEFDVRQKNEVPDTNFDIYISSGGPGNPLENNNNWIDKYYKLIDDLWAHNQSAEDKKFAFFICHSYQLVANHFKLGEIAPRKSTSFGVYPIHKTGAGRKDPMLKNLADPYFAVDSRDWQLIQPRLKVFKEHGATILSLEKIRTHVEYERAIMAVRFSPEFLGTQYHPEADPVGMKTHFLQIENKDKVILNFGEQRYLDMIEQLDDPEKITLTHRSILPAFIENAITQLNKKKTELV